MSEHFARIGPENKSELDRLLKLAETLDQEIEGFRNKLTKIIAFFITYIIASTYILLQIKTPQGLTNTLTAIFVVCVTAAVTPLFIKIRNRISATSRSLDAVLEVLREIEPIIAKEQGWTTLERVEFKIRLSRFYIRSKYTN